MIKELRALPGSDLEPLPPAPPTPGDSPFAILTRLHRLLRGRYQFAIPLAILGAAAGAIVGYKMTTPKYQSTGLVRIQSVLPVKVYQTEFAGPMQMLHSYVRTQANLLGDRRVIARAMQSQQWRNLGRPLTPDEQERFEKALSISTDQREPEWIRVKFLDEDPAAAKIAVEEVIRAYEEIYAKDEGTLWQPGLVEDLQTKIRGVQNEIEGYEGAIRRIQSEMGHTDLESLHRRQLEQLAELDKIVSDYEMQIQQAEAANLAQQTETEGDPAASAPVNEISNAQIAEIARLSDDMRNLVAQRTTLELRLAGLTARFSDRHRDVMRARDELAGVEAQIQQYAKSWIDQNGGLTPGMGTVVGPMSPQALESLKSYYAQFKNRRDELNKLAFKTNDARVQIEANRAEIKKRQAIMADYERRLTMLTTEQPVSDSASIGRIRILSYGDTPFRPAVDNRKKLAAFGLLLGGGVPMGAFLLWGLLDRRYRYSDDAGGGPLQPALLGILPYLPDNMADPEQAAVAAHCVHQIRTLLQISGAHQDRRVFAITSPTSGDGKTSLSLSLGLSFAASGAETCLIDFDLIGGGLSSSMQAKAQEGLLDAAERGEINGHIRPTAFPRLSILPVGIDDGQEVSRLSPELVQRVIDEARRRFDTVIIDTGPILGSIEASMVSAAADGVVLTIGRGQSRTQADRAAEHLRQVGATLIGVVFNRADPRDFRRAVSSASVRSVPMQNGLPRSSMRALPAMGPMASTVATQIGPSGNGTHDRAQG